MKRLALLIIVIVASVTFAILPAVAQCFNTCESVEVWANVIGLNCFYDPGRCSTGYTVYEPECTFCADAGRETGVTCCQDESYDAQATLYVGGMCVNDICVGGQPSGSFATTCYYAYATQCN